MTQIADFDIATDLVVEALMPDAGSNAFLLGFSTLDGTDVLTAINVFIIGTSLIGSSDPIGDSGSSGLVWQKITCEVSQASISVGGEVRSNLYFQPSPASMSLTIQSWDLDPNNNKAFRSGTGIRLRIDNPAAQKTLFSGFIENLDVAYRPEQPNLIQINAFDVFKRYVNTRLASFDTSGSGGFVTPNQQLAEIATALGTSLGGQSEITSGKLPEQTETEVIASSFIYDAIQVALGIFWVDQETGQFVIINRPETITPDSATPIIGNNHGDPNHLCMSDISSVSDTELNTNNLKVSLDSDSAIFTIRKDQDSIDLYGQSSEDLSVNVLDATELEAWVDRAYRPVAPKLIGEVETPAIDRTATLTTAAFFDPGAVIGVDYQTSEIAINDYYIVTRVNHEIDVDNWFTRLELWKGF